METVRFYNVIFLYNATPIKSVVTIGKNRQEAYSFAENIYTSESWTFEYNDMCIGGLV